MKGSRLARKQIDASLLILSLVPKWGNSRIGHLWIHVCSLRYKWMLPVCGNLGLVKSALPGYPRNIQPYRVTRKGPFYKWRMRQRHCPKGCCQLILEPWGSGSEFCADPPRPWFRFLQPWEYHRSPLAQSTGSRSKSSPVEPNFQFFPSWAKLRGAVENPISENQTFLWCL